MGRQRYTVERIIRMLREAEVELARGLKTPQACRKLGIAEQTYYPWSFPPVYRLRCSCR